MHIKLAKDFVRKKIRVLNKKLRGPRAYIWRRKLNNTTVIGITGSCGKTSTTQFIYHILARHGSCHLGIDYNTWERIIKNILKAKRSDRFYIQEISGHEPGAMNLIAKVVSPNISVVTTIGYDHYSSYRTLESVAEEKGFLVERVRDGGTAVLNLDDPYVAAMADRTCSRVLTFGVNKNADVQASNISASWPERLSLTISYQGSSVQINTELYGTIWVTSLLAAATVALAAGVSLSECSAALQNIEPVNKRQSLHYLASGAWVISDCFKAPYWSMSRIIQMLSDVKAPRITLVIGSISDMSGSTGPKYRKLALKGLEVADRVIFVGVKAAHVSKVITPENETRLFAFDSIKDASLFIEADTIPEEVIFIKSGSILHLERIYYSQSNEWSCWKNMCKFKHDCLECHENGLKLEN